MQRSKLPIGVTDFQEIIRNHYLFCDKTQMIADFLESPEKVTLITRPRRWGKTLTLSMLHHFLAPEVHGKPTHGLFDELHISKIRDGHYRQYQGKAPVIFISLKEVRGNSFEQIYTFTQRIIMELFDGYSKVIENSVHISPFQKSQFKKILYKNASQEDFMLSLKFLCECLYAHYKQAVYILIDEYDTPLNAAYISGCLDEVVPFFRALLGAAFKDNPFLARGVLTGILRIARDSVFSGLNHIRICTVTDDAYSSYLGFTESEVAVLFKTQNLESKLPEIKQWYNGYFIGQSPERGSTLYNPWSIIYCLTNHGLCDLYWVHTANNELIQRALLATNPEVDDRIARLINGESVEVILNPFVQFSEIETNEQVFWGLLLSAGYLTATSSQLTDSIYKQCTVRIPNEEILRLFRTYTDIWLKDHLTPTVHHKLLNALYTGEVDSWIRSMRSFLLQVASFFDLNNTLTGESFYHGFCLGLVTQLYHTHRIRSNREAGNGRCDLMIAPKTSAHSVAWVIEFKYSKKNKKLESEAQKALQQIQQHEYSLELKDEPYVRKIIQLGIAFSGKDIQFTANVFDVVHPTE